MLLSFRQNLRKIGEPKANSPIPPFPSGFHSTPLSLKAAMKAMNSPQVEKWQETSEGEYSDYDWTEACQGVANDGQYWYISSDNEGERRIYKFTRNMQQDDYYSVEYTGCKHIGDIDYYDGTIYAAMEKPAKILMVDRSFRSASLAVLNGRTAGSVSPQADSLPWCAINPWNGYLYSSAFDNASEVYAYDPKANFILKEVLKLQVPTHRVQGGCFSKNGHLLLASDASYDIRCYAVLNGAFLGSAPIQIDTSPIVSEEVEGITIWENLAYGGERAHIHVILLDNDWPDKDDIYFKHYTVPNPEDL